MRIRIFALIAMTIAPLALLGDDLGDELLAAARKNNLDSVKALLAKGADVNAKSSYGQTPLFFACDRGNVEMVKLLIDKGANVNAKDTFYNSTALTWAAMKKHPDVVKLLVEKGSNDIEGLMGYAVGEGNTELVKLALATKKLSPGQLTSALEEAEKNKKTDVAAVLKEGGAKPRPPANFKVAPEVLATYAGRYQGGRGGTEMELAIRLDNGKLVMTSNGNPLTLAAIDNTRFRGVEFAELEVEFVSAEGKVTGMKTMRNGNTMEFKRMEAK